MIKMRNVTDPLTVNNLGFIGLNQKPSFSIRHPAVAVINLSSRFHVRAL